MPKPDRPPTEFETRVYDAIRLIPKGKVTTYKGLGQYLSCGSAQAIGQALKRNPFAPEAPCHRVVRTDGSIGGFNGQTGGKEISRKLRLLKEEGVTLSEKGLIAVELLYFFET